MQRTTIYASLHIVQQPQQSPQSCPNCTSLKQTINQLKKQFHQKYLYISNLQPNITQLLSTQSIINYQQQLHQLKSNYNKLTHKLDNLDHQHTLLLQQYQKIADENLTLKNKLKQLQTPKLQIKHNHTLSQPSIYKQNVNNIKINYNVLNQIQTNIIDKSSKKYDKDDKSMEYLIDILEKRIKIQGERHSKIQQLELLLNDF